MRIGIDYTSASIQRAGIGRFTRELVRALLQIDHENSYTLVEGRGEDAIFDSANVSVRSLPFSERTATILWQRLGVPLPLDFFTGAFDVFHGTDFVLPPLRRCTTLLTVHDLTFLTHPECAYPGLAKYLSQKVPQSVKKATMIHANSQNTKKDLVERLGVAPERIEVVYEGVTPGFARVSDPATLQRVREKYQIEGPFMLSAGTIEPRKNYGTLIRALKLLKERGLPHRLLIAGGRGWLCEDILGLPGKLGLTDSVRFLGYVGDEDLPALMSLADVFAFPSLYEGFGLPPLEAIACGTPVVASNTSSLPEVVGDAGILIDPQDIEGLADGLNQALSDEVLRKRIVEFGLRQAGKFTWGTAAEKTLELYRRLGESR